MRYLDNITLDYSGLPPNGTLQAATFYVPRRLFVTAEGLPDTTNSSKGVNIQWSQRLTDIWKLSLISAINETEVDQRGVFPFPFGGAGPAHFLAGARLWDKWQAITVSPSVTGVFDIGTTKHTLNLGLDYEKTKDDAYMVFSNGSGLYPFNLKVLALS